MPCEFIVVGEGADGKLGLVSCGRTAKYFLVRGEIADVRAWLCWNHERYCAIVHQWTLEQLPAPEMQASSTPEKTPEMEGQP